MQKRLKWSIFCNWLTDSQNNKGEENNKQQYSVIG